MRKMYWWFALRPHRFNPIVSILIVVTVFCLLWIAVDVGFYNSEKDSPKDKISLVASLFRKRPVVMITRTKVQNKYVAKAVENSMLNRLELLNRKCREGWKPQNDTLFKKMNLFYYDARRRLGYCHAAKAGCTFWLRVFTFLTRRKELKYFGITSPFMIERVHLHTGSLSPDTANYWPQFEEWIFKSSFRFLFARNPYSRLLSFYLDKHYLLGYSQTKFDPNITCNFSIEKKFSYFLYLALRSSDHHLLPISDLCNPCVFKPHAVGKMETFKPDAHFILDQGNYGYMLRHYNHSFRIEIEMDSIVGENFEYLADIQAVYGEDCMSAKILTQRLWNVFQYNGYIPSNLSLPSKGISYTKYGVLTYFKKIVRENVMDEDQSQLQQARYLFKFYSNIGSNMIERLQQRYAGDFELFGYSKDPPKNISLWM